MTSKEQTITGAGGGVGSYAVQIARAMGAEVTGVCSSSKVDLVRALGAAHVIDYTREELTAAGRTYDAIIDLAGSRAVSTLRHALAPAGTLVNLGGEGGGRWLGPDSGRDPRAHRGPLARKVRDPDGARPGVSWSS
jgi:NADPH:quinone reductase-like Zn-dependent oxidoreductase